MTQQNKEFEADNVSLEELIRKYSKHWKWFLLSTIVCVLLGIVYLRYAVPSYSARAKIHILNDQNSNTGIDLFKELNFLTGGTNEVEDEVEIINSYSNFIQVCKDLGLNKKAFVLGNIKSSEIYLNSPIKINFIESDSVLYNADYSFFIRLNSNTTFGFSADEDEALKVYTFGSNIPSPIGDIIITPDLDHFKNYENQDLKVVISPLVQVATDYKERTQVSAADEFSNIVNLYLEDPVREKAKDILDALIAVYNKNAIEDKRIIADRTSNFIDERIADIYTNLSTVDQSAEDLKTSRGLTDIASEANINLNVGAENQQVLANYRTQLNVAASMQDYIDEQPGFDVLPSNVGLDDPSIAGTTQRYNQLVLERQRLLKSSTERSPIIQSLDQQLSGLKKTMQSSLNSKINGLSMQVNNLSRQQAVINSKIYSAPRNERALRDITRQQQTTESLYLYLLQKREEAQIAVASTAPKSKVIDHAYNPDKTPVSPRRKLIYLASMIFGLIIPFSVIYVNSLIDNKVHNMHTLEKLTKNTPVLGEIPKLSKNEKKLVIKDDRSVLSEALRILRTNLDFLINTNRGTGKNNVIFVTSSVPGEGKTFISTNLAMILASTNKKVVLIGADIRNPKLYTFFMGSQIDKLSKVARHKDAGLTEFLYNNNLSPKDIINPMLVHTNEIDVVFSGRIPPNPAELLMSERFKILVDALSETYDYVLVDTAPLMVVSDTLLISQQADHMIYVTRAGVTDKKAIEFPLKLQSQGKIKGLCFVVNDVKTSNLGYGGKYGYGYGLRKRKWWSST